jgi:hypothetical protein
MLRYLLCLLMTIATAIPAIAYDLDFELDDYFLVEAVDSRSLATETQVWHVKLRRGLVKGREAFVDFRLVTLQVTSVEAGRYTVKDIKVFETERSSRKTVFAANTFSTEIGIVQKLFIKVAFNDDGSLRDLSGSLVNTFEPGTTTNYRLVREPQQIQLVLPNKFVSKDYWHHPRPQQHVR